MVLLGLGLETAQASMTLLNCSLDMSLETRSCEVPMLSSVRDWILDTWTPISRWMPEHSMQTMMPRLVDNHVASVKRQPDYVDLLRYSKNKSIRTTCMENNPCQRV